MSTLRIVFPDTLPWESIKKYQPWDLGSIGFHTPPLGRVDIQCLHRPSDNSCFVVGNVYKCLLMLAQCVTTICDRESCSSTCSFLAGHYAINCCQGEAIMQSRQEVRISIDPGKRNFCQGGMQLHKQQCEPMNKSIHDKKGNNLSQPHWLDRVCELKNTSSHNVLKKM